MIVRKYAEIDDVIKRVIDGEVREYFLFPQFEMIRTIVPAGSTQPLHYHEKILEYYVVLSGRVVIQEGDTEIELGPLDSVLIEPIPEFHTVRNQTGEPATILTFKLLPHESTDLSPIFKSDKVMA